MKLRGYKLGLLAVLLVPVSPPLWAYDWLQFDGDMQHSGNNTVETGLNANNVGRMIRKYQVQLGGTSDNAPVFLQGVSTAGGTLDLLYVTTEAGTTLAVDAATGNTVWSVAYPANGCVHGGGACYTTSAPAIDPGRAFVYAYGLDGKVHKLAAGTGTENTTSPWPITVSLKPDNEKSASALSFATADGKTYLYVVAGGYPGDSGDYQGHITAINIADGSFKVFNTMCSNLTTHIATGGCSGFRSAIWSRPGVTYSAATNRIYFATGNGTWDGISNWSESILTIHPDGSGTSSGPLDSYTPTNQSSLDASDSDLGSTGPVILPVPLDSAIANLAAQGGKDGMVRLVNLDDLSGAGGPGHTGGEIGGLVAFPQGNVILGQPATWVDHASETTWLFVSKTSGLAAYTLAIAGDGLPSLALQWSNSNGGHSPLMVNGVLLNQRNGIKAYDPTTGALRWTTSQVNGQHWQSLIVANGVLYAPDNSGNIDAFANAGAGLRVDQHSGTSTSSNQNGILEPGESVLVEPVWRNVTAVALSALTGTATAFTGPAGATYTVDDNSASYGAVSVNGTGDCFAATADCYQVTVSNPPSRPAQHWDAQLAETLSTGDTVMLTLHIGHSFTDVPDSYAQYRYIETMVHNNVSLGYGDGTFQPDAGSIRAATALFVGRALVAPGGNSAIGPTGVVGAKTYDCRPGGNSLFTDVLPTDSFCKQVHQLAAAAINISFGCGSNTKACPNAATTREQMAVIIAGAMAGSDANVPSSGTFSDSGSARSYNCTSGGNSHFPDVPVTSSSCRHINYLWARGVVDGYSDGTYEAALPVTRGQMAKFVTNGKSLTLY